MKSLKFTHNLETTTKKMAEAATTLATTVAYDLRPLLTGRWDLMTAQHWGVVAGIITYTVTVSTVLILLVMGGTCQRLREQNKEFQIKGPAAFATPFQRSMLYDELLEASSKLPIKPDIPVDKDSKINEIKGLTVTLRLYNKKKHLSSLFAICNGKPCHAHGAYDPDESIFRFLDDGPFESESDFENSPIMSSEIVDGVRLVIVDNATGYLVGMVSLTNNDPKSLRISVSDLWITPGFQRTHAHTDAQLTLLKYLFSLQYRRVEVACHADDARSRKSIERIGYIFEGLLRKHRIVRNANQDTAIYSMLNSDWRDGGVENLKAKLQEPKGVSAPTRQPPVMLAPTKN
jgi:RimJ/RimL family protein N-acetyltransferase